MNPVYLQIVETHLNAMRPVAAVIVGVCIIIVSVLTEVRFG